MIEYVRRPVYPSALVTAATIVGGVFLAGCEVTKKNQLAPTDAVLTIAASNTLVPTNGSTTVTVQVKKSGGQPVEDGTEIGFTASGGELDQRKVRTAGGEARANFTAKQIGTARVTAASGSLSVDLSIRVTSAMPGNISVVSTPNVLPPAGGDAELLAVVSSPAGAPIEGAPVVFSTSAGTLSNTGELTSDAKGEAKVMLKTTSSARVVAKVPDGGVRSLHGDGAGGPRHQHLREPGRADGGTGGNDLRVCNGRRPAGLRTTRVDLR